MVWSIKKANNGTPVEIFIRESLLTDCLRGMANIYGKKGAHIRVILSKVGVVATESGKLVMVG